VSKREASKQSRCCCFSQGSTGNIKVYDYLAKEVQNNQVSAFHRNKLNLVDFVIPERFFWGRGGSSQL